MFKKIILTILLIFLIQPLANAKNFKVLARIDRPFTTEAPISELGFVVYKDLYVTPKIQLERGAKIEGYVSEFKPARRGKRNGTMKFSPKSYTIPSKNNKIIDISNENIIMKVKPFKDFDAQGVAKSAGKFAAGQVIPFFSQIWAVGDGIKNPIEGKTRTRSVGIKLYESTPLSYFNKGEELELEKYGLVTLHSKIKKQDIKNSNETIDLSDFLPEPEESIYSEADNTIYHPIPLYGRSE